MRLYLARHAKPAIAPGICYGSSDLLVPQDEHERVVSALACRLPRGLPVFSSPLRRCSTLAAALAVRIGSHPPTHDARLAEMHFGQWEMRAWEDIAHAEVEAWASNVIGYRPGGGESVLEAARRVHAFYADRMRCGEDAVVVCHAGTIRLLLACQHGGNLAEVALAAARDPGRIACGELVVGEFPSCP